MKKEFVVFFSLFYQVKFDIFYASIQTMQYHVSWSKASVAMIYKMKWFIGLDIICSFMKNGIEREKV